MYNSLLYHGTERCRGEEMIHHNTMRVSRGDKHWLGDGSYFYEQEFYAFKWIKDMYNNWFPQKSGDDLLEKYMILEGNLSVPSERIFNLDNPINKIEFDRAYLKCKEKQVYSQRFNNCKMAEGVVINIMFNEMRYNDIYDLVIATFKMREDKYKGEKLRLNFISEKQYCVKNLGIIKVIKPKICTQNEIDTYNEIIDNLNFTDNKKNYNIYKSKNRKRKFNKFK